jgi:diguanylate cyclase (GGDEF)-like protein
MIELLREAPSLMKDLLYLKDIHSGTSSSPSTLAVAASWMRPDSIPRWTCALLLFTASAWGGIELGQTSAQADIFWPTNGIVLAILLRLERRYWASYVAGSVVANILAHAFFPFSLGHTLIFSVGNTGEIVAGALLLSSPNARKPDLTYMRTLGRFVLFGVLLAPLVSTAVVELLLACAYTPAHLLALSSWFLGDALGIAIMTPLILAIDRADIELLFGRRKRWETIGILAGMAALSCAVFAQSKFPVSFLLIPALLLAIFRLGSSGAAIGIFLMAAPAAWFTDHTRGPFSLVHSDPLIHNIFMLQSFFAVALITLYAVTSALSRRDRLHDEISLAFTEADAEAARDHITGLANRRTLDKQLAVEWQRAVHEKGSLSLLMIDVDHFKLYNDHFGHVAGDECLRRIAAILSNAPLRVTDLVARYGGEEFAVLLPRALSPGATAMAERIRQSVSDACLPHREGILTISIGVATLRPSHGLDEVALIQQADRALYAAKSGGRNRVQVWQKEMRG